MNFYIEGDGLRIPYEIIRSDRKTLAIEVRSDLRVIVRAPRRTPAENIERFINEKKQWIIRKYSARMVNKKPEMRVPIPEYMTDQWLRTEGVQRFQYMIDKWSQKMHTDYGRVTLRDQKTRWGSCSSKGNLNFNWRLLLMPETIMEYVVVHELAHRREMNHSPRFWQIVAEQLPDYQARRQWLKENGERYSSR